MKAANARLWLYITTGLWQAGCEKDELDDRIIRVVVEELPIAATSDAVLISGPNSRYICTRFPCYVELVGQGFFEFWAMKDGFLFAKESIFVAGRNDLAEYIIDWRDCDMCWGVDVDGVYMNSDNADEFYQIRSEVVDLGETQTVVLLVNDWAYPLSGYISLTEHSPTAFELFVIYPNTTVIEYYYLRDGAVEREIRMEEVSG